MSQERNKVAVPKLPSPDLKIGVYVYTAMRNLEAAGYTSADPDAIQTKSSLPTTRVCRAGSFGDKVLRGSQADAPRGDSVPCGQRL